MSAGWRAMHGFILGTAICLASVATAQSDEPGVRHIGVLDRERVQVAEAGLRNGLREQGYVEGKNLAIEWRRVSDPTDANLRAIAVELARSHTELIVAFGTPESRAALQATTVPVVFVAGDPVGSGLAESLAHPGGRGTGVSMLNRELAGKRMDLLRQVAPGARRIVLLMNPANPLDARMLEEAQASARALGVKLTTLEVSTTAQLEVRLGAISHRTADGFLVSNDQLFIGNSAQLAQALRRAKLPAVFPFREYHEDGVLMSYGPSLKEGTRKAAAYVAKILQGARPGDLPIEQVSQLDLVVDLRVANEIGVKVPQELLYRADEVIR